MRQEHDADFVEKYKTLGALAAEMAGYAAVVYLEEEGLAADNEIIRQCLKKRIRGAVEEAFRSARLAVESHRPDLAENSFTRAMATAGMEAAKEAVELTKKL